MAADTVGKIINRPRPLRVSDAAAATRDLPPAIQRLLREIVERLEASDMAMDRIDPASSNSVANGGPVTTVQQVVNVTGSGDPLILANRRGIPVGTLVNVRGSTMTVADAVAGVRATHAVGAVIGSNAYLFNSWNVGPARVDNSSGDQALFLGTAGRFSLAPPPFSNDNSSIEQSVGSLVSGAAGGVAQVGLNISSYLTYR